jgi:predicted RNase H-like nuclease (RuvC/YqgF family)
MRSHSTTATDVLSDRRPAPERDRHAALQRELAQSRAMCRRHELAIEALTHAVAVLRRGAAALTDENRELRAQIAGARRRSRA